VWDKTPSGRKREMRGSRGSSEGNIFRDLVPSYGKFNQRITPYNDTFNKVTKVLQNQYTSLRQGKR